MNKKIKYLIPLIPILIIGGVICLLLKVNYLTSILIFIIIPSIYFSSISKRSIKKSAVFSLAMIGVPLVIDGLLIVNHSWLVETMFSFKILGLIPIEDILFPFFSVYLVVIFYEYLLRHS